MTYKWTRQQAGLGAQPRSVDALSGNVPEAEEEEGSRGTFTEVRRHCPGSIGFVPGRERRIANLRADGLSTGAIARVMGLHETTVARTLRRPRVREEVARLFRLRDTLGVVVSVLR